MIKSLSKIEFVYFDVGGVLIQDFSKTNKWEEMLVDLGLTARQRGILENMYKEFEQKLCAGMDSEIFLEKFSEAADYNFPENYNLNRDFIERFERNPELIDIMNNYQEDFGMGLLTNMTANLFSGIKAAGLLAGAEWDILIDSSVVGVSKPEPGIFEIAENRCQVKPQDILFIDNTSRHLVTAKKRGWQTLHFDSGDYKKSNKLVAKTLAAAMS